MWYHRPVDATALILLLGAAIVVYVLIGYPLLLGVLPSRRPPPVKRAAPRDRVSVILPVYNGGRWLKAKLESLLALDYPKDRIEILVVSDGSTDDTAGICEEFASRGVRFWSIPRTGKWAALNCGIEQATGDILFFTDVRQMLDRACLQNLTAPFADPSVGVVSGELVIRDGATQQESDIGLYWRYEKRIRKHLSRLDSMPGATGAVYAMRRELARPLPPHLILDDMYLPLGAFFRGYRVVWEASAKAFDSPTCLREEFWRKVRTLAGNYQILSAYPQLLGSANRMRFHFLSYKFGRLLLPFVLISIAAASIGAPGWFGLLARVAQVLFYGTALLDLAIPETWKAKRLSSPVRTFVVLMAATLCAASIAVIPAKYFWRSGGPRPAHNLRGSPC